MKLIIDIDDDKYNMFCKDVYEVHTRPYTIQDIFRNGTPLDDVLDKIRAEIEALPKTYPFINHIDTYVKEDDVKRIIDKYKAESEE